MYVEIKKTWGMYMSRGITFQSFEESEAGTTDQPSERPVRASAYSRFSTFKRRKLGIECLSSEIETLTERKSELESVIQQNEDLERLFIRYKAMSREQQACIVAAFRSEIEQLDTGLLDLDLELQGLQGLHDMLEDQLLKQMPGLGSVASSSLFTRRKNCGTRSHSTVTEQARVQVLNADKSAHVSVVSDAVLSTQEQALNSLVDTWLSLKADINQLEQTISSQKDKHVNYLCENTAAFQGMRDDLLTRSTILDNYAALEKEYKILNDRVSQLKLELECHSAPRPAGLGRF